MKGAAFLDLQRQFLCRAVAGVAPDHKDMACAQKGGQKGGRLGQGFTRHTCNFAS